MHGARVDILKVLEKLDSTSRRILLDAAKVPEEYRFGGFDVTKDLEKDRFITDARPPNSREIQRLRWTRLLGFPALLGDLLLGTSKS